ncbi:glycosyltransferase family 2 protein [Candidatus Micrarchaeota archaeon]|nr:glycosyltransferase family 2 protein [Candidatus Micrarchaeota archaeon]
MKISFIIPIFNEKDIIREFLSRMLAQSRKPLELIFVDESKDETPKIIEECAKKNQHVRLFHFEEKKGVSFSKNYGAKQASGDIIVFMDADMFADANLVEEIEKTFSDERILMASWKDTGVQPKTFIAKCYFVRARYYGETRKDVKQVYAPRCYRKKIFEKFNGFDEKLKYYEDVELGERIAKSGLGFSKKAANEELSSGKSVAVINAFVAHVDPASFKDFEKQNAWLGDSLSFRILWEKRKVLFKPLGPAYWALFFSLFALSFLHSAFFYAFLAMLASVLFEFTRCVAITKTILPSAGFIALSALKVFITAFAYAKKLILFPFKKKQ